MVQVGKITFCAHYEEDIKSVLFNAMDVREESLNRMNVVRKYFSEFPEFFLISSPKWNNPKETEISRDSYSFYMSPVRLQQLYNKIKELFPKGTIKTEYSEYPITIHQFFMLPAEYWTLDDQTVFYCPVPVIEDEAFNIFIKKANSFDYTYMYSDSGSTLRAGHDNEDSLLNLMKSVNYRNCVLWYNYILRRVRSRPQDASFGIKFNKEEGDLTKAEAFIKFNIIPTIFNDSLLPKNGDHYYFRVCRGFPPHTKKNDWMEGDLSKGQRPYVSLSYDKFLKEQEIYGDRVPL